LGSLSRTKCESIDRFNPMAVTREGSRFAAAISGSDFCPGSLIEIFLAKIVTLRYIGFTSFIRYVDVRIALARENISKLRNAVRLRSCVRCCWASRRDSSAFTHAGG